MRKKPYIFKKHDAISKSDPTACFHAKEDERILGDLMNESAVKPDQLQDRTNEFSIATKHKHSRNKKLSC